MDSAAYLKLAGTGFMNNNNKNLDQETWFLVIPFVARPAYYTVYNIRNIFSEVVCEYHPANRVYQV
jgi:hypothetical protein